MTRQMTMQVTIDEICLIERLRNVRNSLKNEGKCVIMVEVGADGSLKWWVSTKGEQARGEDKSGREGQRHPGYRIARARPRGLGEHVEVGEDCG
jgi:hypothetical protein